MHIAFIALLLICIAWAMQTYSLIDWEGAVSLGVQNESFDGNATEQALADVERGIAIADILWAFPLTIIAFIGLFRKKLIGFIASLMTFSICIYFPLFYAFRENIDSDVVLIVIFLWAIPSFLGIIGLWQNRKLYLN